jgi:toxin-antitoxin system PIN domain toxin
MANLLDVNFLVALAWPNHMSHALAVDWFSKNRQEGIATCLITESGFVRISLNPLIVGQAISLPPVLTILAQYRSRHHEFWPDDLDIATALAPFGAISGHRQITDAYLLALAASRQGTLVTLDAGIAAIAPASLRQHLVVVGGS